MSSRKVFVVVAINSLFKLCEGISKTIKLIFRSVFLLIKYSIYSGLTG